MNVKSLEHQTANILNSRMRLWARCSTSLHSILERLWGVSWPRRNAASDLPRFSFLQTTCCGEILSGTRVLALHKQKSFRAWTEGKAYHSILVVSVLNRARPVDCDSVGVNPRKEVEQQKVKQTCADIADSQFRWIFRDCSASWETRDPRRKLIWAESDENIVFRGK